MIKHSAIFFCNTYHYETLQWTERQKNVSERIPWSSLSQDIYIVTTLFFFDGRRQRKQKKKEEKEKNFFFSKTETLIPGGCLETGRQNPVKEICLSASGGDSGEVVAGRGCEAGASQSSTQGGRAPHLLSQCQYAASPHHICRAPRLRLVSRSIYISQYLCRDMCRYTAALSLSTSPHAIIVY